MKDPLTKAEIKSIKKNFLETFDEVYGQILKSGALDDSFSEPHNHIIARMALVLAAEKYEPISSYKNDFENVRRFV